VASSALRERLLTEGERSALLHAHNKVSEAAAAAAAAACSRLLTNGWAIAIV
jgi:hypothetical protein